MDERGFLNGKVRLFAGDCRDVLKGMADNSVDSVVTDPPYHLQSIVKRFGGKNAAPAQFGKDGAFKRASSGFMSKTWDGGDIAFQPELWEEVLRVLKPGGYIMAFSGCRTYHRMACAIEDAGFITHPMFAWCFGQGFPKAHNLSKQLDRIAGAKREVIGKANGAASNNTECRGDFQPEYDLTEPATAAAREWDGWFYGTQSLKPALEPIFFGQKPFEKGLNGAQNVQKWGTGAINVGACKIPSEQINTSRNYVKGGLEPGGMDKPGDRTFTEYNSNFRWPANLLHDNSEEVLTCFPESSSSRSEVTSKPGDIYGNGAGLPSHTGTYGCDDSGSAARFFASFPQDEQTYAKRLLYHAKACADDRCGSRHPTVKPIALLQELARLITPRDGLCLDLFAGSGTTGEACFREGFRAILIENDPESVTDIERRMSLAMEGPVTRAHAGMKARGRPVDNGPLFGGSDEPPERYVGSDGIARLRKEPLPNWQNPDESAE